MSIRTYTGVDGPYCEGVGVWGVHVCRDGRDSPRPLHSNTWSERVCSVRTRLIVEVCWGKQRCSRTETGGEIQGMNRQYHCLPGVTPY
jgi:hypothetical protein